MNACPAQRLFQGGRTARELAFAAKPNLTLLAVLGVGSLLHMI
jgi:hypothetical protein